MGIWNTSASPIGYAYQSAKGSGINIKPINPKIWDIGNESENEQTSRTFAKKDELKGDKILSGTNRDLRAYENNIDNKISILQKTTRQKILSLKDEGEIKKEHEKYNENINYLYSEKSRIATEYQNAQFGKDDHSNMVATIKEKKIGSQLAVVDTRLGDVIDKNDFLRISNPVATKFEEDKSGNKRLKFIDYNNYQQIQNEYSSVEIAKDEQGRDRLQRTTNVDAPVMNVLNSEQFDDFVKKNMTEANNIITETSGGDNGKVTYHTSTGSSGSNLIQAKDNVFNTLSKDAKAYAITNTLQSGLLYHTGVFRPLIDEETGKQRVDKKGKPITTDLAYSSGENAIAEINNNKNEIAKLNSAEKSVENEEKKQKLISLNERLAAGIVDSAKEYVIATAANDIPGLLKYTHSFITSESQIAKSYREENQKNATALTALLATMEPQEVNYVLNNKTNTGLQNWKFTKGGFGVIDANGQEVISTTLFKDKSTADLKENPEDLQNRFPIISINGATYNSGVFSKIAGEKVNVKIIGIGNRMAVLPATEMTPSVAGEYYLGDYKINGKRNADGSMVLDASDKPSFGFKGENYFEARAFGPANTTIPVPNLGTKEITYMKISDISPELQKSMEVVKVKGGYEFNVMAKMPNEYSTSKFDNVATAQEALGADLNEMNAFNAQLDRGFKAAITQKFKDDEAAAYGIKLREGESYAKTDKGFITFRNNDPSNAHDELIKNGTLKEYIDNDPEDVYKENINNIRKLNINENVRENLKQIQKEIKGKELLKRQSFRPNSTLNLKN